MKSTARVTPHLTAVPDNLSDIAAIVCKDWKKIYFGAVPYLTAMQELSDIRQDYGQDSATSIIRYFLANATTWRGDTAKAVKAKLKELLQAA